MNAIQFLSGFPAQTKVSGRSLSIAMECGKMVIRRGCDGKENRADKSINLSEAVVIDIDSTTEEDMGKAVNAALGWVRQCKTYHSACEGSDLIG